MLEKCQFFNQKKQLHRISLNSQFTDVLNSIICFSVRFCDNSLLMLKVRFQVFSFASKKVQVLFNHGSFIYKTVSQFFEILIFSQDICGNVHYVPEIIFISSGTLIKAFHLPNKTIQKKSERRFCRRKRAEDNNAKINIFPKIPCTFLLFKVRAFLQIFFPRKSKF